MPILKKRAPTVAALAFMAATTSAFAADYGSPPSIDWSGFYVGVQGGYGMVDASAYNDYNADGTFIYESSTDLDGVFGGVHAGYNFLTGSNIVFGVEADLNIGDHSQSGVVATENGLGYTDTLDAYDINAFGSGRIKLGYAAGNFMPYLTGGLAVASLDTGYAPGTGLNSGNGSETAFGYTLGAGAEYALSENLRLRAEYRYTDYGTTSVTVNTTDVVRPATNYDVDLSSHNVSMGLTYAF